jgi:hypothetical protein
MVDEARHQVALEPGHDLRQRHGPVGVVPTGGIKHEFDLGLELSREKNSNASYSTFTTSGAACPDGLDSRSTAPT